MKINFFRNEKKKNNSNIIFDKYKKQPLQVNASQSSSLFFAFKSLLITNSPSSKNK